MYSSMIGKIAKAKQYAQEPDRIQLTQFEASFRGENLFAWSDRIAVRTAIRHARQRRIRPAGCTRQPNTSVVGGVESAHSSG